jgi:DNA-binding transcriptional regulator GbsR (MarR family)
MAASTEKKKNEADDPLWESERIVSDTVGRFVEFVGFKRNMGRVWALLYLSDRPLTARDLRERLAISSGSVSMTLSELVQWGVVRKVWMRGERRDFYLAEGNLWKMVSRVLRERERSRIIEAIEAFEEALECLEPRKRAGVEQLRARVQRERIEQLLELARLARAMLDALINSGRVDASWLPRFVLGQKKRLSREKRNSP